MAEIYKVNFVSSTHVMPAKELEDLIREKYPKDIIEVDDLGDSNPRDYSQRRMRYVNNYDEDDN